MSLSTVPAVGVPDASLLKEISSLSPASKAIALGVLIGGGLYARKALVGNKLKNEKTKDGRKKEPPFWPRFVKILKLLFNGRDRNLILVNLTGLTACLVLRTIMSIQVAVVTGQVAQFLVEQNWEEFVRHVSRFAVIGIPAAVINSGLKYFTAMLSLRFRRELTTYINKQYIVGVNFYKANELPATRIESVDQRVTADVETFCDQLSNLYASVFKPILDIVLNTWKLSSMMGLKAPVVLFAYYISMGFLKISILTGLRFRNHTKRQSELSGIYRTAHSRLITYSEEIAFFEGSEREKQIITKLFDDLFAHSSYVNGLHGLNGILDQYLAKYGASITGYALLCLPVFFPRDPNAPRTAADLTRDYISNRQLLMDLATGIGKLLETTTKVASFTGITSRVSEVLEAVKTLQTTTVQNFKIRPKEEEQAEAAVKVVTDEWLEEWRQRGEALRKSGKRQAHLQGSASAVGLATAAAAYPETAEVKGIELASPVEGAPSVAAGRVVQGDMIEMRKAWIVSPDGRLLVRDLNIKVPHGCNVMITGPNGCGKSSMFRVIGELWPPYSGEVVKPGKGDIVFVPQKPYLVMGSLRDQLIYPHSRAEMDALGVTDADLEMLLDIVDPARSIVNAFKFDDVRNWSTALSGGQKQRVAMARVFYHRPRYAILDECTSAVSHEVEGKIYTTCRKIGITLFTVSHRPNLQQYHDYQLRLDGHGGWSWLSSDEVAKTPLQQ